MLRHCVIFELNLSSISIPVEEHLQEIKLRLEQLPEIISGLEALDVYLNCNPAESSSFMLQADVEDMAALDHYAHHPAHEAIVREWIAPYKVSRSCIDYLLYEHYPH